MQQLSLLEPEPDQKRDLVHAWHSLDDEHRACLVARLSRLIVAAAVRRTGESNSERGEQDHH